jgi:F0F1-type ATP synthase membrane subunit b/b'
MSKTLESKSIEQLLAEADDLIRQINSDAIKDIQEEHRLQFERHAQSLEKIKSKVQGKSDKKGVSQRDAGAEGMHEAILDIVKAMHNFKKNLFKT